LAWTQTQLDALDAAIARGVLTVRYADREVTYQSIDAMLKARAVMAQSIAAAAGTSSTRYAAHDKGVS
jgi:hypothetical protein